MSRLAWLNESLHKAATQSGRSVFAIIGEMIDLRRSVGRMGVTEYFDFRLYLNDLSIEQKRAFGGRRGQAVLNEIFVDEYSNFLSLDKATMYSLFRDCGFPMPPVRALYQTRRPSKAYVCLETVDDLTNYLRIPANLPVYIKRSCGSYGQGNTLIVSVEGNQLTLGDDSRVDIRAFCESLEAPNGLGWILQEPLQAHPQIAQFCGNKISGVRIHTFLTQNGPRIHRAIFKINIGNKDSDNFHHGASGNMLAQLDAETGTIQRVISGIGFDQVVNPRHPVTGADLRGFTVPHWSEIRRVVLDAAMAFPGFICPGWDIAVCEDGPKLLEINSFGDIDLSQHVFRCGFIDDQLIDFMRGRGLDGYLAGTSGNPHKSPITSRVGTRRQLHWSW